MVTRTSLRGRTDELRTLDRVLDAIRSGESRVLVVRGEPGVGKTALLEHALESAAGFRIVRAACVEAEMELAFAALQLLCAPMLDRFTDLPAPQSDALGVAFGLQAGDPPDPFLVGLAVLSLLSETAEEQPLLCVVDDAHWLDRASAQALAFVARRLHAESVGLVFATRTPSEELAGAQQLVVEGLREPDARALLESVITGPLDERVRDRIVAETGGNPLALLELPHGLTPAELAGGFGLPNALPLSGRIEESFRRRLDALPPETQTLLLVAAAEPVGDPALLRRAAERLDIGFDVAASAESAGLLSIGARVSFRHPLVRSAVYAGAGPEERRRVHQALADATNAEVDPDRRAWHRAHASAEPDEAVAQELERSASRARARGGVAAAAAFLERATELTPDPAQRVARALAAAQAKHQAGAPDAALALLATAEGGPLDELQGARVELLHAQIVWTSIRGADAPALLLRAAKQLEPLHAGLTRQTYIDAFLAAVFAGRSATRGGLQEVAEAIRACPRSARPARAVDLLLDGLALVITEGHAAGAPTLTRAINGFRNEDISTGEALRWLGLASHGAVLLWDDESWSQFAERHVRLARETGALSVLPSALNSLAVLRVFGGNFEDAALLVNEIDALTDMTGRHLALYAGITLAALRGRESELSELIGALIEDTTSRGAGLGAEIAHRGNALLGNGLGRYELALDAAERGVDFRFPFSGFWILPELVEAATRLGKSELAIKAFEALSGTTRPSGNDWGLGIEARSRALTSDGAAAESLYREAIDRLGRTRMPSELARAHLLYGEWLRRESRRTDAREQLATAHAMLSSMGAEAFAARAARELSATGGTVRKRTVDTRDQLTAQETQIAQLARDGLSNPEIGARLFISAKTVQYHLHKVFGKLGITSRIQLDAALAGGREVGRRAPQAGI